MSDLEDIRKKKFEELKKLQGEDPHQQEQQLQQQIQQLEAIVKQAFTKEALERFGNLKTAFPEKAVQLLVFLAQAIQTGQITKIDDNILKEILKKIEPKKKEFKIKRV